MTLDDVKKFYAKYYGPKSMIFVLVGDLDHRGAEQFIKKAFNGWVGGVNYHKVEKSEQVTTSETVIVELKEKTSATLRIAQTTGLKRTDKDYLALSMGNSIFGMGGFSARLMSIIRDDEGLTYGINSTLSGDTFSDGQFAISGTFSPDLLAKGYSSTMREFKRWVNEGVTEEELKAAKTRVIGGYKVGLSTTRGLASMLLSITQRRRIPWPSRYRPPLFSIRALKPRNDTKPSATIAPGVTPGAVLQSPMHSKTAKSVPRMPSTPTGVLTS